MSGQVQTGAELTHDSARPEPPRLPLPHPSKWSLWLPVAAVLLVATILAIFLQWAIQQIPPMVIAQPVDPKPAAPPLKIDEVLHTLKLVTAEAHCTVRATRRYEDWRGGVEVELAAPARLLYGVDLEQQVSVHWNGPNRLTVFVPEPKVLYADVDYSNVREEKRDAWGLHFNRYAGQTQVTLCLYEDLPRAARQVALQEDQISQAREGARRKLRDLLEKVVPSEVRVEVEFVGSGPNPMAPASVCIASESR
jgi:hypothetical protein